MDNTQLEVEEDEAKPKEASSIVPMKHSWTRFVPMLKVFGKSFLELLIPDRFLMPLNVPLASFVYFGIAASFYF